MYSTCPQCNTTPNSLRHNSTDPHDAPYHCTACNYITYHLPTAETAPTTLHQLVNHHDNTVHRHAKALIKRFKQLNELPNNKTITQSLNI